VSCGFRPCDDLACPVCTTTARGFPQPDWKKKQPREGRHLTKTQARRDGLFDKRKLRRHGQLPT